MLKLILFIVALFIVTGVTYAQEDNMIYTDDRYQVQIPKGWEDRSTPEMAHFVNENTDIFVQVVEAGEVAAGIQAALEQIVTGFNTSPVQSTELPLPDGSTWTQNVYMMPDGVIIAALGRTVDDLTYTIIIRAPQAELAAHGAVLNEVLFSHTLVGETPLSERQAEYVDTEAFTEEEIVVISGAYELPATLSIPVGKGPFPAVVIVHGSGPNDRDGSLAANKPYRDIAHGLASQGIAVLRYDKRTFVYREPVAGFTVDDEVTDDALAAVDFLKATAVIDTQRIYVVGHSLGAMFAPRIAERDSTIAGIIVMAGSPRPFDIAINEQIEYLLQLDPNTDVAGLDAMVKVLEELRNGGDALTLFGGDVNQAAYWSSIIAYNPGETAQSLDIPMLILQGERDYQATMNDFAAWQEELAENENVTFISYPTLNHIFMPLGDTDRLALPTDYNETGFVDETVIADLVNWIKG